jgi:archaellum component FlaG (FlaF/FlaG flagellin family)
MRNLPCLTLMIAALLLTATPRAQPAMDQDQDIANKLAAMLRAGRAVISNNANLINDPAVGDKGLDGRGVLAQVVTIYHANTGGDPLAGDPGSRENRLLRAEMDAIVEVMDANAASINAKGVGFKGFIPAVFSRLVGEAFSRRAGGEAELKVTAPPNLVRNRRARPDAWEAETIVTHFQSPDWKKGEPFAAVVKDGDRPIYRIAVPEYYSQSCLSCHGTPRGATDITGYPKEGAALGDLGGVISIKLAH